MAPSRGLSRLIRHSRDLRLPPTRSYSQFRQIVSESSRKSQIYISRSFDPYVNLSIEHFLLQETPPESTVLFLYTNKPCIVIGRNQNPWVEVNLGLLDKPADQKVNLVRRRSGGGTVFHDEGNVNYSVICPTPVFNRDRHAQMVVDALRRLGVTKARVNERHDIVLDINASDAEALGPSIHEDVSATLNQNARPLKVSGSAYKITRLRSVHHGTCLLNSPRIGEISKYLRSPAKPYIKARGVNSVSSPITNVNVGNEEFEQAVVSEFQKMYGGEEAIMLSGEEIELPEIAKGLAELKSLEWIFQQTPQFTFSLRNTDGDSHEQPPLPEYISANTSLNFTARNGIITEFAMSDINGSSSSPIGIKVHEIEDWSSVISKTENRETNSLSEWLNTIFGIKSRDI